MMPFARAVVQTDASHAGVAPVPSATTTREAPAGRRAAECAPFGAFLARRLTGTVARLGVLTAGKQRMPTMTMARQAAARSATSPEDGCEPSDELLRALVSAIQEVQRGNFGTGCPEDPGWSAK